MPPAPLRSTAPRCGPTSVHPHARRAAPRGSGRSTTSLRHRRQEPWMVPARRRGCGHRARRQRRGADDGPQVEVHRRGQDVAGRRPRHPFAEVLVQTASGWHHARIRGHGAARTRRKPHGDQAGDRLVGQRREVRGGARRRARAAGRRRRGRCPGPCAASARGAPRCRTPASSRAPAAAPSPRSASDRFRLREDPGHDAIVQLGDDRGRCPRPARRRRRGAPDQRGDARRRSRPAPRRDGARAISRASVTGWTACAISRSSLASTPATRAASIHDEMGGCPAGSSRAGRRTRRRPGRS